MAMCTGFASLRGYRPSPLTAVTSLSLVLGALIIGVRAKGAEIAGVNFEDSKSLDDKTLQLNGVALRKKFVFKVYAAGLYLGDKSQDESVILNSEAAKHLRMVFLRDVDAEKIRSAWLEGFEANCETYCEALAPKVDTLNGWMTDLKEKDELSFTFRKASVEVMKGGKSLGTVEGEGLDKSILGIFIGKNPATEDLKSGLLGKP